MYFSTVCGLLITWLVLASPPAAAQEVELPHLRELTSYPSYGEVSEGLEHAVEKAMRLPPGYPADLEQAVLVHLEVSLTGQVENPCIVPAEKGVDAVVATSTLAAVRQLPVLMPGRQNGQPVRTALTLLIRPGVVAAAANAAFEARTLQVGTIRLRPGETLGQLLHRTLPATCTDTATELLRYAWHPSAYGPQLFFSAPGHDGELGLLEQHLFILDPIGPAQYAVQTFDLTMDDMTTLDALFFADANHDGQKDLLALTEDSPREEIKVDGHWMAGRSAHYRTTAFYYRGLDRAGHPIYKQQERQDLDELATAAAVRRRLAAPPKRPAAKPAKR